MPNLLGANPFDLNAIQPFVDAVSITPSDTADLDQPVRGLLVAATGNVKVAMYKKSIVTLYCVAGTVYNVVVNRVYATGTAATGIVGLY